MIKLKHQLDGYMDQARGGGGYDFRPGKPTEPLDPACFEKLQESNFVNMEANDFKLLRVNETTQFLVLYGRSVYSQRPGAVQGYFIELPDEEFEKIGYDIQPILKEAYKRISENIKEEQAWPALELDENEINQLRLETENKNWQLLRETFKDRKSLEEFFKGALSGRRFHINDKSLYKNEIIAGIRSMMPVGIRKEMTISVDSKSGYRLFGKDKQHEGAMYMRSDGREAKTIFFKNFNIADGTLSSFAEKIIECLMEGKFDEIRNLVSSEEGELVSKEFIEKENEFTRAELEYREREVREKEEKEKSKPENNEGVGLFRKFFR